MKITPDRSCFQKEFDLGRLLDHNADLTLGVLVNSPTENNPLNLIEIMLAQGSLKCLKLFVFYCRHLFWVFLRKDQS